MMMMLEDLGFTKQKFRTMFITPELSDRGVSHAQHIRQGVPRRLQNAALCADLSGSGVRRRGVSLLACLVARTPLDSG